MAALTVLIPTVLASYSILQDGGVAEPTYVTLQPPELSSIPMSISSSYTILSEGIGDESKYVLMLPRVATATWTESSSGSGSSSGGGSSAPSQSWYFS